MPFLRLLFRFLLTLVLVWVMDRYLDSYILITGGWKGFAIVAGIITVLNLLVRPILDLIVLPLRLLATILSIIVVNAAILWITVWLVDQLPGSLVGVTVLGGIAGWLILSIVLGLAKWVMSLLLR